MKDRRGLSIETAAQYAARHGFTHVEDNGGAYPLADWRPYFSVPGYWFAFDVVTDEHGPAIVDATPKELGAMVAQTLGRGWKVGRRPLHTLIGG